MGIVAVVILHRRFIGQAAVWAGAIIALSPGFIFYSRYAIHESLFILTQVVFSYGFFLWWERRNLRAVCLMVGAIVAMIATKETFFIFFGTWFIAVFATDISLKMFPSLLPAPYRLKEQEREPLDPGDIWAVISLGVVVLIFLFTGFLMYMHGAIDMVTAMTAWTKTGVASTGHEKPFYFWLQILTTYEWSFLGALVLSPIAFLVANRNGRVLILSGIGIWIAYSIIPYKTPWLVLNILWLIAVALGVMIADGTALLRKWKIGFTQPLICLLALAATGYSTYTSWRLNFRDFTKVGEPYVYVQTTLEFKRVTDILEESLRRKPEALTMKIAALNSDPWPLPWVLDIYPNLQWGKVATSDLKNLQLILIDAVDKQLAEAKMTGQFYVLPFQIRDSYQAGFAYLSVDQFKGLLPEATPMFTGNTATPVSDGDHP
jgi:4-amino-4-deoxy-L-arabinose transferase-like glycosyltransferase